MKLQTVKPKWYVAVQNNGRNCDIIKDHVVPTQDRYPNHAFMFGGYRTRREALEVAMYHNYYIDTPEPVTV